MELPDPEKVRALMLLCESAGVAWARFGNVEFSFHPPAPPEPVRLPPAHAGKVVGGPEKAPEKDTLPPGYRALFPNGIPTRSE